MRNEAASRILDAAFVLGAGTGKRAGIGVLDSLAIVQEQVRSDSFSRLGRQSGYNERMKTTEPMFPENVLLSNMLCYPFHPANLP